MKRIKKSLEITEVSNKYLLELSNTLRISQTKFIETLIDNTYNKYKSHSLENKDLIEIMFNE